MHTLVKPQAVLVFLTRRNNDSLCILRRDGVGYSLPRTDVRPGERSFDSACRLLDDATGYKGKRLGGGWVTLVSLPVADEPTHRDCDHRIITIGFAAMDVLSLGTIKDPELELVPLSRVLYEGSNISELDRLLVAAACQTV